jgi:hypothetical protein
MRKRISLAAAAIALGALGLGALATPANAANTVNTTFHIPVDPLPNPCAPADIVNFSGDVHVVMTVTAAKAGGYSTTTHISTHLSGQSITTGTRYISDRTTEKTVHARPPYPVTFLTTETFTFVSQSGTDDFLMHLTMRQTIAPGGVPSVTADNFRMECKG